MEREEEQTKQVARPVWQKVVFGLGPYAIGFLISCALMGSRFRALDALVGTVLIGTLLVAPILMLLVVRWMYQGTVSLAKGGTRPSTFVNLMIAGPIITIVITLGLYLSVHSRQQRCDKAAEADLHNLSAAVERFDNELTDLGCSDLRKQFSEEHIKYLVGPYYGWRGTTGTCKVLVRIENGELQSCAMRGSRPTENKEERKIFRSSLLGIEKLDPTVGACKGKQYGYFPDHVYFASMVEHKNRGCVLREPADLEGVRPWGYDKYHEELSKQHHK